MSKSGKIIVAIVIVAVIVVGAVLLAGKKSDNKTASSNSSTQNQNSSSSPSNDNTTADVTITYDGSSFKLSSATLKSGGKVKIVNNSTDELEFESNPHPTHTDNPELNAGDIAASGSKTITLTTKGKWGFHNHYHSSQQGQITVE